MNDHNEGLFVKSHVGRDLLQNAALFRHERQAVWEYVANSLQYIDPGAKPVVRVIIDKKAKRISILDNGRGMKWHDLQDQFFVMHGENVDRKKGRPGRGMFGTGKSAAFGIGDTLRISTVRDAWRSKVELRRVDIERMSSGDPIPVRVIEKEVSTHESNGTVVEIDDVFRRTIDRAAIIRFVEQHIARWPDATVYVDRHLCEYNEPPVAEEYRVRPDDDPFKSALGNVELLIKVSKAPLGKEQNGIAIFSSGVWHETTLAGCEGREMAHYIFGEIDVPALTEDSSPVPAFDLSRSMQLNRENEVAKHVLAFIGMHVDEVRRRLVEEDKKRRASQEAMRLQREAEQIARILNEDFQDFRSRLARTAARSVGGTDDYNGLACLDSEVGELLLPGEETGGIPTEVSGATGRGEGQAAGGIEAPNLGTLLNPSDVQEGQPNAGEKAGKAGRRPRGGFSVEFREMGESEPRAKYEREDRTIYINLDHPQLKQALGLATTEEVTFRRLAYEVAFAEYAVALAYEMSEEGHFIDLYEPVFEVRKTLDRIARAAAHLYRS